MSQGLLGRVPVGGNHPVKVMAVLNLSPESFYGGSVAVGRDAIERAQRLARHADVLDVGAMSTAPYKEAWITPEEELKRLQLLPEIVKAVDVPVSVDTYRPKAIEFALKAGAEIINDVTGLKLYPEACRIVADHGASIVLVARERVPKPGLDPVARILEALEESLDIAVHCGIEPKRIVVDPGIGFPTLPPGDQPHVVRGEHRHGDPQWPWWRWDLKLLLSLPRLKRLGYPILVGVSRKSFLRKLAGVEDPADILPASLAAEALAAYLGADVVRTHNPQETRQALTVATALRLLQ